MSIPAILRDMLSFPRGNGRTREKKIYALLRAYLLPRGRTTSQRLVQTRVPDQTPLRLRHIQSGYNLSHSSLLLILSPLNRHFHHLWWAAGPCDTPLRYGSYVASVAYSHV